jgi:ferredoxin-type protein NapH
MKSKTSQLVMIWFLPLIVIGGLFFPVLGYLVLVMAAFFLVLSIFKPRYWCWNFCPRGSFLDMILSRISMRRHIPEIFFNQPFRWLVFVLLMGFLTWRLVSAGNSFMAVGAVFVMMCVVTTLIAIVLGVVYKERAWCMICPMGNLQEQVGKIRKTGKK